ncbi:MAG: hypothetical protein AAF602_19760, partial [Myxococcota bacterium]
MSEVLMVLGDVPTVQMLRHRAWDVPASPGRPAESAFRIALTLDSWDALACLGSSATAAGVDHRYYCTRDRHDLVDDAIARSIVHELHLASWDARERLVWMTARLVDTLFDRGLLSSEARAEGHARLCADPSHVEATFPHLVAM